jgi:hypothetical protein
LRDVHWERGKIEMTSRRKPLLQRFGEGVAIWLLCIVVVPIAVLELSEALGPGQYFVAWRSRLDALPRMLLLACITVGVCIAVVRVKAFSRVVCGLLGVVMGILCTMVFFEDRIRWAIKLHERMAFTALAGMCGLVAIACAIIGVRNRFEG